MATTYSSEAWQLARLRVEAVEKAIQNQRDRLIAIRTDGGTDEATERALHSYEQSLVVLKKRLRQMEQLADGNPSGVDATPTPDDLDLIAGD